MPKERWASRLGLVLAMAGNAVGLGNFLRFPAQAVQNGGGAFLIPYIVALVLMGLPLMWVEWAMGRYGGQHGHHSTPGIFQSFSRHPMWKYFGVLGLWSCLIIAAFYLYIESWCMAYAGYSLVGGFRGMNQTQVQQFFANLTGERPNSIIAIGPIGMVIFFACIAINIYILSKGLSGGVEIVAKIGMPLLIVFAAILGIRGLMLQKGVDPGVEYSPLEGLNFVWQPKFDRLDDPKVWLAAAGQIFFTLSIGMGSIHCFSSYLRKEDDVALTGATTAWTNEFCEVILGGTILIPIAVAYLGMSTVQENSGFALGFFAFPTLFNNWGWFGPVAGFMWFGLLFFAAITSSLAMGQPIMSFLQEEFGMTRGKSALALALMLLPLALPVALFHTGSFFDEFDYWGGTVMLVVFALGETILFAWIFGMGNAWAELNGGAELKIPGFFYFVIKYVTPVFLIAVLAAYVFKVDTGADSFRWADDGLIGKVLQLDIDNAIAQLEADTKLTAEKRGEKIAFQQNLRFVRNIDRVVMIGVFVFLSALVAAAWNKRAQEGRT
jgi:NSS family neurotransmitter:Na+ symporter